MCSRDRWPDLVSRLHDLTTTTSIHVPQTQISNNCTANKAELPSCHLISSSKLMRHFCATKVSPSYTAYGVQQLYEDTKAETQWKVLFSLRLVCIFRKPQIGGSWTDFWFFLEVLD